MHRVLVALALIACHNDSISHPDIPPLPPASGTPVGFIVDSAADLKLTDAQVASLKDIDSNLSGQLDIIDMRLKAAGKPATARSGSGSASPRQQPGGFQMAGGRRGRRQRSSQAGSGAGSGSAAPRSPAVAQLENERENDVRAAISRALDLLDATQRKAAVAIFNDRGLDLLLPSSDASAGDGSDDEGSSGGEP
ncbi:MAG TPA: hypothetical protein VGO00_05030 [Kofleriaceae bacterium]|nr:hypothetical protein [Kofleriaceae bacterium]